MGGGSKKKYMNQRIKFLTRTITDYILLILIIGQLDIGLLYIRIRFGCLSKVYGVLFRVYVNYEALCYAKTKIYSLGMG